MWSLNRDCSFLSSGYLLFFFLAWLLWLGLPVLRWIEMVKMDTFNSDLRSKRGVLFNPRFSVMNGRGFGVFCFFHFVYMQSLWKDWGCRQRLWKSCWSWSGKDADDEGAGALTELYSGNGADLHPGGHTLASLLSPGNSSHSHLAWPLLPWLAARLSAGSLPQCRAGAR